MLGFLFLSIIGIIAIGAGISRRTQNIDFYNKSIKEDEKRTANGQVPMGTYFATKHERSGIYRRSDGRQIVYQNEYDRNGYAGDLIECDVKTGKKLRNISAEQREFDFQKAKKNMSPGTIALKVPGSICIKYNDHGQQSELNVGICKYRDVNNNKYYYDRSINIYSDNDKKAPVYVYFYLGEDGLIKYVTDKQRNEYEKYGGAPPKEDIERFILFFNGCQINRNGWHIKIRDNAYDTKDNLFRDMKNTHPRMYYNYYYNLK